nr:hypothetical protein [Tanacetum cinerariifolium]
MDFDLNNQNDQWELNLDIDDFDLRLTPVLYPYIQDSGEGCEMSTQEYIKKVIKDVGGDEDLKSGLWVSVTKLLRMWVGMRILMAAFLSPKPSMHYLSITMRNVVKVFHKDTIPGSGSGVGGSGMLDEEEIVKLLEVEDMAELELQVCGNVTNQ